jgi:hypothetical protein
MRRTTTAEVRPDAGRATRLSASAQSTGDFDHLPRTRHAICRCSRRPKGRAWPHNDPESGECPVSLGSFRGYRGRECSLSLCGNCDLSSDTPPHHSDSK